ncbi:hypothetical protein PGIGA_G00233250 [Pangasianodon gigas]|uniref:Uncharacterized protein n=1 Tax=Pangasianodon gigas TaxID=30993 RepID=A0ACC5WLC5_PANGG|nr:hypothetical protein [Pangasianodon gigas]
MSYTSFQRRIVQNDLALNDRLWRTRFKDYNRKWKRLKNPFRRQHSMDFSSWMTKWICKISWKISELR